MSWRNGQGSTAEIARGALGAEPFHHADDDPDGGFDWRLSIADIAVDAPFSRFDGYDRVLTVIEGAGMRLVAADGTQTRLGLFERIEFAGEDALDCRLLDGPTRDLNLMVRRSAVRFAVDIAESEAGPQPDALLYLAVVLRGTVRMHEGGQVVTLAVGETVVASPAAEGHTLTLNGGAEALLFQASLLAPSMFLPCPLPEA